MADTQLPDMPEHCGAQIVILPVIRVERFDPGGNVVPLVPIDATGTRKIVRLNDFVGNGRRLLR